MILADAEPGTGTPLVLSIALAGFSALTTLAGAFFAWRSARDKLAFDAEKATLAGKVSELEVHVRECNDDRTGMKVRLDQHEAGAVHRERLLNRLIGWAEARGLKPESLDDIETPYPPVKMPPAPEGA